MKQIMPRTIQGHTLLELIMATGIVAATLVPALEMLRNGMTLSREIDHRNLMATYCMGTLEKQLAIVGATWSIDTVSGDFATDGYPDIRYVVERSDVQSDGGIPGQLMSIVVTVYDDMDQNDILDSDDPRIVFRSKIARLATYTDEADT